jgi:hypothetical protein
MSKNGYLVIPIEKFLSEELIEGQEKILEIIDEEFITFHEHPDILKEIEKSNEHKKKQEDEKFKQLMDRIVKK